MNFVIMKEIELKPKDILLSSLFAAAFVKRPAIEEGFVFLSKEGKKTRTQFLFAEEKGIVYTPVLIPEQRIPRLDEDGNEYMVYFTAETIEQLNRDFQKAGFITNWNLEHNDAAKLEDVAVVESWIKADMKSDKSLVVGLSEDLPVGTLFWGIEVKNEELKEKIRNKEVEGISIEADLEREVKLNKNNIMNEIKLKVDEILTKLSIKPTEKTEEVKLGEIPLEGGEVILYFEGDEPSADTVFYIDAEMTQLAPEGEHTLADGSVIRVDSMGMIVERVEAKTEENVTEMNEKTAEIAVSNHEAIEGLLAENKALKEANASMEEKFNALAEKVESHEVKLGKVKLEESVTKLSEATEVPSYLTERRNY